MHLFEYDIIDNPFILDVLDNRVVLCNELQPNIVQEIRAPFGGSYTEILREKGTFSISKRGYILYGSLISLDEKNRLKSHIEGGTIIGTTKPYQYKGKMYQAIEVWITKDKDSVDNAHYIYKRDVMNTTKSNIKTSATNKTQNTSVDKKVELEKPATKPLPAKKIYKNKSTKK